MALVAAHPAHGFAHWKAVVFATVKVFFDPDTSPRCAATAFFGFLSFFPAIATVALIYGIIANEPLVADTVKSLGYVLPPMALTLLDEQLKMLATAPRITLGLGLLISVPLALWSGSRGVEALLFAMSRVRGAPERRGFIKELLVAVGMTIGGSLFVAVALATVAGLPALIPFPTGADWILLLVRWPVLLVISIVVMALLYRFGPDRHPHKFRFIWPGAVLASLLWLLAGAIFSIYVQNWGHYSATFGSVSAAVVLLLWMYNSAQILVLGAAFNAALEHEAGEGPASGVVTSDYAEALPPR
ncbi:MAG: YihY/virulence factor BrkB family protein [Devosia sp.]|jgi:membrane protein